MLFAAETALLTKPARPQLGRNMADAQRSDAAVVT